MWRELHVFKWIIYTRGSYQLWHSVKWGRRRYRISLTIERRRIIHGARCWCCPPRHGSRAELFCLRLAEEGDEWRRVAVATCLVVGKRSLFSLSPSICCRRQEFTNSRKRRSDHVYLSLVLSAHAYYPLSELDRLETTALIGRMTISERRF